MSLESPQVGYGQASMQGATYKFNECLANNNGLNIAMTTSEVPVIVNIDPEIWNNYESYLQFTLNIAASVGNYIWTREDVWSGCISHIQFYQNASTAGPVDLEGIPNYLQIVLKKEVSLKDLLNLEERNGLYPSNAVKNAVPALQPSQAVVATPNPSQRNYQEPAYYQCANLSTAVAKTFFLPMRLLKNTMYSLNKDVIAGTKMFMKIFFAPIGKFAFASNSNISPSAGAITPLVANVNTYINNLKFFQAIQTNLVLRQAIISKASAPGGLKYVIPYVKMFLNSYTGTNQNGVVPLDSSYGNVISKLYYSLYNNTETELTAFDNCNFSDNVGISVGKVTLFQTFINGDPLQVQKMDCTPAIGTFMDYNTIKSQLKESIIQTRQQYQQNWFWCEEFSNHGAKYEQEDGSSIISGKSLSPTAVNYKFNATIAGVNPTYQHYCWGVFYRTLVMDGTNMMLE
jgi:hypothetical protein